MKKVLFSLFALVGICTLAYAQATPSVEENNRLRFTVEGQGVNYGYTIKSIAWTSASGDEVAGTGGFILIDNDGKYIAGAEATAITDSLVIPIPDGIVVNGVHANHLDGDITIYGKRK